MLGLRRWHKNLLISEVLATAMVLWANHRAVIAPESLDGHVILSPGSRLLFWASYPPRAFICLAAAVVYAFVFFGLLTFIFRFVDHARWSAMRPMRMESERHDLNRYLR